MNISIDRVEQSGLAAIPRHGIGGLRTVWTALPPTGRVAFLGVLASAIVAVALGIFIPLEIRQHLLVAESRGLQAAVTALAPQLPDLSRPLTVDEIATADRLVDRSLLDADHVRAKLWSLDGTVIYSDAHELIGRHFDEVKVRLDEVVADGAMLEVTELDDPENVLERPYTRLIEYYLPVRDGAGRITAVFEIYEDVAFLEQGLSGITTATWLAIGSGLSILLVFIVLLVLASVRSINRDRARAEARAEELGILVGAAQALASSLEPTAFFAKLEARIRHALGLSRLAIETATVHEPGSLRHRLRDGSWLVAQRDGRPFTDDDERVLRSVAHSLDAALANASLYAEVRDAAVARRDLLRKVVEAHEDERRHLVGDLHDSLAGELIRILYGIRGISARAVDLPGDIRADLSSLERLLAQTEHELRGFMNRIGPAALDEFGLAAALQAAIARFREESHLDVALSVRGSANAHSPETQLVVLRAAEEALLNVRKHAQATRVRIALTADGRRIRLTIDDDGVGWRPEAPPTNGRGLGLAYLRERVLSFNGTVRADRSRLGGARLAIEIPLEVA